MSLWERLLGRREAAPTAPAAAPAAPMDHEAAMAATETAVAAYWAQFGASDPNLISYLMNPQFQGAPAWPNTRQAYRVVRTADSLIVASDGLADPAEGGSGQGIGMEVFIDVPGLQALKFEEIKAHWIFAVAEMAAQNMAHIGGIVPQLNQMGVMSMELPLPEGTMPADWLSPRGTLGILLGMPTMDQRSYTQGPLGEIKFVSITIIRPGELAHVMAMDSAGRQTLAKALIDEGVRHRSDPDRHALIVANG